MELLFVLRFSRGRAEFWHSPSSSFSGSSLRWSACSRCKGSLRGLCEVGVTWCEGRGVSRSPEGRQSSSLLP